MTIELNLTPLTMAYLDSACRSAGLSLAALLATRLTRHAEPAEQGGTPAPAAPILTETPESLAALPPVLSTAGQGATPAPATTTGHPAAPVDTTAALAHFGLTL